ncbi:MAG TPA: thioesterase family protein [Acidimicrobiales bacterium]|nr:thioesterase family protein [Acidimicrobiales bacterium]
MSALYTFDGSAYLPGPMCVGPWSPDAQHGGPVSALLAGAVEAAEDPRFADVDVQVVRLTVELLRPVPLRPLTVASAVVRPGRNVQLAEATMLCGDTEVARARALRIRRAKMDVPVERAEPPGPVPDDDPPPSSVARRTAFAEAVDLRFVRGSWDETGPVTMWTRLQVAVVDGVEPSPLQRATAAADFGNGVSRVLEFDHHTFINPDLTVALARVPEGEWVGFDVVSRLSTGGFGQAESAIFDPVGPVGRSVQSLLVSER